MTIPGAPASIIEVTSKLTSKLENHEFPGNLGFDNMMPLETRKKRRVLRTMFSFAQLRGNLLKNVALKARRHPEIPKIQRPWDPRKTTISLCNHTFGLCRKNLTLYGKTSNDDVK